jgi:SAM-dependent methyltransferase
MMKKKCKFCNNFLFNKSLIEFKDAPNSAQNFSFKKKFKSSIRLQLYQCSGCGLVQVTNKPVAYYKSVIRAVGISKSMMKFRKKQFSKFLNKYKLKNKNLIEIGCGTGDYLNIFSKMNKNSFGIEGSNKNYKICKNKKLKVFKGFVNGQNYKIFNKKFDAFFIFSYFEHIPNLNDFIKGIHNNLKEDAVGIIEVPNFEMILKKKLYTEFIIDHLYYFTKKTLKLVLECNGFEIIESSEIWNKYILSVIVRKRKPIQIKDFNALNKRLKIQLSKFIKKYPSKKVAVWGAGHQALTVISLTNISKKIKYIIDSAKFKQNKFAPGLNLKIVSPNFFRKDKIEAVIVMAAGFSNEVCKIIKSFNKKTSVVKLENNRLIKF